MLIKGVLNVILSTIIASALKELIVKSTRVAIARGVKALNKGGATRGKGKRRGKSIKS
jgi:hypothetical protein